MCVQVAPPTFSLAEGKSGGEASVIQPHFRAAVRLAVLHLGCAVISFVSGRAGKTESMDEDEDDGGGRGQGERKRKEGGVHWEVHFLA